MLLDARPVADAVIEAVSEAIAHAPDPAQAAYDRSMVPGTNGNGGAVPDLYAQVDVDRRFDVGAARVGSSPTSTAWRITVGAVSSPGGDMGATVREAEWVLAKTMVALEDRWLTTAEGDHEFVCRFEAYRAPEHDAGSYWGSVTFTAAT